MHQFPQGTSQERLAKWMGVCRQTIAKEIQQGRLKAQRKATRGLTCAYHIQPEAILDWLNRHSVLNIEEDQ